MRAAYQSITHVDSDGGQLLPMGSTLDAGRIALQEVASAVFLRPGSRTGNRLCRVVECYRDGT